MPATQKFKKLKIRYRGKWQWNYEEKKLEFINRQNKSNRWHYNKNHPQPNVERTIPPPSHGRDIYFWWNVQNKRVVYSFTKDMDNYKALKQLTFVGKKTVPSALRKDMWRMFLHVQFQTQRSGLLVWHYLREFRKRHETAYDPEILRSKKRPARMQWLMDQKANSVADLAASLKRSEDKRTRIYWDDLYDAEYAKTWPPAVEHDTIKYDPGTGMIIVREVMPDPDAAPPVVPGSGGKTVDEVTAQMDSIPSQENPQETTRIEDKSQDVKTDKSGESSSWLKKLTSFAFGDKKSSSPRI